jgi:GNAT superfamily N-acetyltransferase
MELLGTDRGPRFYETALAYAQALWRAGFPAKCLLLVNRALACVFPAGDEVLHRWPLPYSAVAWILANRREGQFIGNPRRHYQHLATRMVEPHKELRAWRAWACWYLAKELLPESEFPCDLRQIRAESLVEPPHDEIMRRLRVLSLMGDEEAWLAALHACRDARKKRPRGAHRVALRQIGPPELPKVRQLAHLIWPRVYPGIISEEQIRYMLARFYEVPVMEAEIEQRGTVYALIEVDGREAGYLSFDTIPKEKGVFLNKLYLMPELHGLGAGAMALEWAGLQARRRGFRFIRLRVNRHNAPAVRAYLRSGFVFLEDHCQGIGGGFMMDDFVMEKTL